VRHLVPAVLLLTLAARTASAQPTDPVTVEQALFVGGAQNEADMTRLRALYHARIDPIVAAVRDQPPAIAAQLLLKHLHQSYGGTEAVLKAYKIDASSISDPLTDGSYNCVAATTLFLLAARDAGLDVTAEMYDSHARAVLAQGGRQIKIEPTMAYQSFDIDHWMITPGAVLAEGGQRIQSDATSAYPNFDVDDLLILPTGSFRTGPLAVQFPHAVTTDQLLSAVYTNDLFFGRTTAPSLAARTTETSYFFSSPSAAGFSGRSTSSSRATSTASPGL
jgi:hypothetical protein